MVCSTGRRRHGVLLAVAVLVGWWVACPLGHGMAQAQQAQQNEQTQQNQQARQADPAAAADAPPQALDGHGLQNLLAFGRMVGFVRYFHPSDEAAGADWDSLVIAGVREVEGATSPEALAETLNRIFRPIAPAVSAFTTVGDMGSLPRSRPPADPARTPVVAWTHRGLDVGTVRDSSDELISRSVFESWRTWIADPTGGDSMRVHGLPDPRDPWVTDLTGGISAIVPLALYADEDGTLPRATPRPARTDAPADEGFAPSGNDRATRLAVVILAWNAVQHFNPYDEAASANWPSALARALMEAAVVRDERAFLVTLQRMMGELQDGQAEATCDHVSPTGRLPLAWDWIEDGLFVTYAGPRAAEDVRPGDRVLALDDLPVDRVVRAVAAITPGANERFRTWRAVQRLLAGELGATVRLRLLQPDGQEREVRVVRSEPLERVREPAAITPGARPAPMSQPAPGIVYLNLDGLSDDAFHTHVEALSQAEAIIFDLRGGRVRVTSLAHLSDETLHSARWQIPVVTRPDGEGRRFQTMDLPLLPAEPVFPGRVAILVDESTIGAAEIYASIAKHYALADIVGSPTAGSCGEVIAMALPGGYRIRWTGMKVLKPDGSPLHRVGVHPTVPVARTVAGVAAGRDEVLERAVQLLSSQ